MGIKSSAVRKAVETIKPSFEGEKVEIRYYPGRQSVGEMRQMGRALSSANLEDQIALIAKWVSENIEYVDWTDDDGQPVPLEEERLQSEPFSILEFIFSSVMDHKNKRSKN